ncbi:MAG: indole-3-glycerol phosphate synthase [Melioribacteraceae bacterium]|nr:MAG: indole-3-glycerol phosphate synthase [Melioribacteraceae bacterium]
MTNILREIVEVKKEEVAILKRDNSLSQFRDSKFWSLNSKNIESAFKRDKSLAIISEIKKASPSKGIIREDFDHLNIAEIYSNNDVDAISVLTDKNFFKGDISFLYQIAERFDTPLLRKDFIISEYQVYEAKANGANIILLISEILSQNQIQEITHAAYENNMEVLLELHSYDQAAKIDFSFNRIIGINNRDLRNFSVDVTRSVKIGESLKNDNPEIVIIGESGFSDKESVKIANNGFIDGLLVGEHFMRAKNIDDSVKHFKEWCLNEN